MSGSEERSEESSGSEPDTLAQEVLNTASPEAQALANKEESRAAEKIAALLEQKCVAAVSYFALLFYVIFEKQFLIISFFSLAI
jgi:hypothetical protein